MNNTSKDTNDLEEKNEKNEEEKKRKKSSDLIKHILQKQTNWKTQPITSEVKSEEPRNIGSSTGSNMLD